MTIQSKSTPFRAVYRFYQKFSPVIAQQYWLMAGSMGALFAEVAFRLLEPWPIKYVIDRIVLPSFSESVTGSEVEQPILTIGVVFIAVVAIVGLRALCAYCKVVGFALAGNRVLVRVRELLYSHLQQLSLSFHARSRSGDLVIRVMSDIGLLKDVAVTALLPLIANILVLMSMIAVMFWLDSQLTLVALMVGPLIFLAAGRSTKRIQAVAREQRRREGSLATITSESLNAIGTVQSLSLGERMRDSFSASNAMDLQSGVRGKRLAAGLERKVDVIVGLGTAAVLVIGTLHTLRGRLTPGELLVILAYLKSAFKPVRNWAKYTGRIAKASAAAERVLDVMDEEIQVRDSKDAVWAPKFKGAIACENVNFGHEGNCPVLINASFEMHAREHVALMTPSGAGKSTLFSLLLRLYDPEAGRILIDGIDIRKYKIESLRQQISVLLQRPTLFAGTIADNIAYGAIHQETDLAAIEVAARRANIHDYIRTLPNGYQSAVGERGVTLSAGQQQRIGIARAILRDAPILILDEPTSGLDAAGEAKVSAGLEELVSDRTTLIATHSLARAREADRILTIDQGMIREYVETTLRQPPRARLVVGHALS